MLEAEKLLKACGRSSCFSWSIHSSQRKEIIVLCCVVLSGVVWCKAGLTDVQVCRSGKVVFYIGCWRQNAHLPLGGSSLCTMYSVQWAKRKCRFTGL